MNGFVAAAIQLHAGDDKRENFAKAEAFIRAAAQQGARLVALPEVWLWRGPQSEERGVAEPIPGPTSELLAKLARTLGIHLLAGSLHETAGEQDKIFNTSLLFGPQGELLASYRKIHLFDVDIAGHVTIRESAVRQAGRSPTVVETALAPIGLSICYDLRFPELYRRLAQQGARVITAPSAFTFATGSAHWDVLVRARAIENQVYMIAPNQLGASVGGVLDYGNSLIVDPWGKPLAHAADREMVIYAEIDLDYQDKDDASFPAYSTFGWANDRLAGGADP